MNIHEIITKFKEKPYLLTMGKGSLSKMFNCSPSAIIEAKQAMRNIAQFGTEYHPSDVAFKNNNSTTLINNNSYILQDNVLIIGDLHAQFTRNGYLDFCKNVYRKYRCNKVVFIGDLIDNHYSSFHDTDPDGHSAAEELKLAKLQISKWYKEFPEAKVCIGNHDLIPIRKSFNAGLSNAWIKSIGEVLDTPNWEYGEEFVMNNVLYTHGVSRKAFNRMQYDLMSVVQGHYHSEGYIIYSVGKQRMTFAMQVGCGVDDKSYAMAYGKHFNKMHISCGVILNDGRLPILEYMQL